MKRSENVVVPMVPILLHCVYWFLCMDSFIVHIQKARSCVKKTNKMSSKNSGVARQVCSTLGTSHLPSDKPSNNKPTLLYRLWYKKQECVNLFI